MPLNPKQFNLGGLRDRYEGKVRMDAHGYEDPQPEGYIARIHEGEYDYDLMHEEHERRMTGTLED